jgi:hypothetical protein
LPKYILAGSFHNPAKLENVSITVSVGKESQVYAKMKSELSDIQWRKYSVRSATNKIKEKKTE